MIKILFSSIFLSLSFSATASEHEHFTYPRGLEARAMRYDFQRIPGYGPARFGDTINGNYGPGNYGLGTRYGMGGYGDAATLGDSLNICTERTVNLINCKTSEPDSGLFEWRFVKNIGWRKFSRYGAARKDFWDYKKTLSWPFNNVNPYSTYQQQPW